MFEEELCISTAISLGKIAVRLPLGPVTVSVCPDRLTSTPSDNAIGFFPILLIILWVRAIPGYQSSAITSPPILFFIASFDVITPSGVERM